VQDFSDSQSRTREKPGTRFFFTQFDLVFIEHLLVTLPEEEIEGLADFASRRLETARTHLLERYFQRAINPNLIAGPVR